MGETVQSFVLVAAVLVSLSATILTAIVVWIESASLITALREARTLVERLNALIALADRNLSARPGTTAANRGVPASQQPRKRVEARLRLGRPIDRALNLST